MKRSGPLAVVATAVALTAFGYSPAMAKDHKLTLHAKYDGGIVTIDEDQHDEAHLAFGDHLIWKLKCDACPKSTALEIQDIRHLAILSLMEPDKKDKYLKNTKAGRKVKPDYGNKAKDVYKVGAPFRPGFDKPDKKTVKSKSYLSFDDDHMWKFTWVIKVNDEVAATWDPHFSGGKRN